MPLGLNCKSVENQREKDCLKTASRKRKELIEKGAGYALVATVVGVEKVCLGVVEILRKRLLHGEETTSRVEIYHRNSPDAGGFENGLYVAIEIKAAAVGVVFSGLMIRFACVEACAVNGSEQNDLFGGEELLEL